MFQLEELQEMVRRGMDAQKAREHGMALLEAEKVQPAPRMFISYELSQALRNERGAKPMNEIVQFAHEMKKPTQAKVQAPSRHRRVG